MKIFQKVSKSIEKNTFFLYNKIVRNIGVSPSGKASDSDSDIPVFESQYPSHIQKLVIDIFFYQVFYYIFFYLNKKNIVIKNVLWYNYNEEFNMIQIWPEIDKNLQILEIYGIIEGVN